MQNRLLLLVLIAALAILGCDRRPKAVGTENQVTILADPFIFKSIKTTLDSSLERTLYTPWPESLLELIYLPMADMNKATIRPNILMAGVLDGKDRVSQMVRSMLPEGTAEQVQAQKSFMFKKENPWAENQLLLVLVSTDTLSLRKLIRENGDQLFSVLHSHVLQQTRETVFERYEQKELSQELLQKYGWRVRVQHDYHLYREFPQDNFVMLRRTTPERWLFVHWVETDDPEIITKSWMIQKRNEIGEKHYEGDVVVPDSVMREKKMELFVRDIEFAGRPALEIQGLWENNVKNGGGPFKAFAFYDEEQRRAYLVDIAVFAPGETKEAFMRQLEVIARTFQTDADSERQKAQRS